MSINNHFTSHIHHQTQTQTPCRWSKHYMMQQDSPPKALSSNNSSISCNNNNNQQQQKCEIPKEPLFEKPLTPSDVGKLNRLVIPKQYAERYFPMRIGGESDEKGSLLSFEDEVGKSWRFRYSYWNSSQSYVLTKGWSRFVKEKRLDAGDVVVFFRHRVEPGCHFIGWRRRNSGGGGEAVLTSTGTVQQCGYAGSVLPNQTTIRSGNNSTRMLRLFGVNLECELAVDDECDEPPSSTMSSQGQVHHYYPYHQC